VTKVGVIDGTLDGNPDGKEEGNDEGSFVAKVGVLDGTLDGNPDCKEEGDSDGSLIALSTGSTPIEKPASNVGRDPLFLSRRRYEPLEYASFSEKA